MATFPPRPILLDVEIAGMQTVHCVRAVFTALAGVEGIVSAEVERGRAEVVHDGRVSHAALRAGVELAGYSVTAIHERRRELPVI